MADPLLELTRYLESFDDWEATTPDGEDDRDEETYAAAMALQELKRRAAIEKLLDEWLYEDGALRAYTLSAVSVKLHDYRADRSWFAVRDGVDMPKDADDWTCLEAVLKKASAP